MSNKRYSRRSEFKARLFLNKRDRMSPLLVEFGIPIERGYRIELDGAEITDDPKYHDYSLEFFALDPSIGEAGKTGLVYPLADGRELHIWVQRLLCTRTVATYQELWCAQPWPERDNKPYGWQSLTVTTTLPRDKLKRETGILLNGLPLLDKVHERTNGYSRAELSKILFAAAERYATSEPDDEKFKIVRCIDDYVPLVHTGYPISRSSVYFYFRKYRGLKDEVTATFTEKQRKISAGEKVSTESRN